MSFPTDRFKTLQTPFYYYDTAVLDETLATMKSELAARPAFNVHYAIKANANPAIMRRIAAAGLGADCVSGGEVKAALFAGFKPERIVFAGVGKADWEINLALDADIACFNVESLPELRVISELAVAKGKVARIAFRVNPNVDAHTHEKITTGLNENKFGIAMEDLIPAIREAEALPGVTYTGLHFHIGSQILEFDVYERLCERINELLTALSAEGVKTQSINVGGGLGIDYDTPDANPIPAFAPYFALFEKHLHLAADQQLHFELGRSVVAQCGSLITKVLYVKQGHAKKFLIVDAGFTELIRPAMYGAHHCIQNLTDAADATDTYDVVGPICESSDVFDKDVVLPVAQRGSLLALRSAGAYGEVMASTYNCRSLPESYFSDEA